MPEKRPIRNGTIKESEFAGERFEFTQGTYWIVGPNAVFNQCDIVINVKGSHFIVSGAAFNECSIVATKRLDKVDWHAAKLVGCSFFGEYSDCDFGPRPDIGNNKATGYVSDCQFTDAILDGCRFFNVDVKAIRFPRWPTITIIDHPAAARDFRRSDLSPDVDEYADILEEIREVGEVAVSWLAMSEAKRLNCTEAKLRTFLQGKAYAVI